MNERKLRIARDTSTAGARARARNCAEVGFWSLDVLHLVSLQLKSGEEIRVVSLILGVGDSLR